jgi:hypothetical protein
MRDEHQMSREDVRQLQKDGIPMAMLKDEEWVFIQPNSSQLLAAVSKTAECIQEIQTFESEEAGTADDESEAV